MKTIAIAFLFIFLFNSAQSQQYGISLEGGPSITQYRGKTLLSNPNKSAIYFSGVVSFHCVFSKQASLVSGISFAEKGGGSSGAVTDDNGLEIGTFTFRNRLRYVCAPIMMRVTFGDKIKYFVNGGIFAAYLLDAEASFTTRVPPRSETTRIDIREIVRPFDCGATLGMGLSIKLDDSFSLTLHARDEFGLFNVSKPLFLSLTPQPVYTNAFSILLGVAFTPGNSTK
jgi:hypothetical protein